MNLKLWYWNDEIGDMDLYDTGLDLEGIAWIREIVILVVNQGEEVALVEYVGDRKFDDNRLEVNVIDENEKVVSTIVAYSANPDYKFAMLMDPDEEGRYILYNKELGINKIDKFMKRESAYDI